MAVTELISRLEQEAQLRVEEVQNRAAAEVAAIEAATVDAAREATRSYLAQQRTRREAAHALALASARRDARTRELEATHAAIARVLDRARQLLDEVAASAAYVAALPAHAEEALSFLEQLRPRVTCTSHVATLVRAAVDRHPGAALVIDESIAPGIIAEADDRSVVVDNTLRARLERREADLTSALARKLNDGGR